MRTTAVRLSIAYTIAFAILAVIVVVYMTGSAVDFLRRQHQFAINEEASSLRAIYDRRGLNALVQTMERRASAPGANLYVIADPVGRILVGNIRDIEPHILENDGWVLRPFAYQGFQEAEDDRPPRAVALIFKLPNGMTVLVGHDVGDGERFRGVVARTLRFSMGTMLLASFLIWFFIGRSALKRIDMVSRSTERIMAGDRTERLPITGARDEFDRLSVRMNEMLDRLGLLDDGLRSVSDSIAHDLKTPLTRLRNKAEVALSGKLNLRKAHDVLQEVIADSDQLIKIFNALLMISRVESGSQVAELSPVDMSEIMHDICELYEPVAEDQGIAIKKQFKEKFMINGNRELLSQAITNLLDNALKYGRPVKKRKAVIEMKLYRQGKIIVASICDNGSGIPEKDRDLVKQRFARLDESRTKPGTGLGLSLVDAVAKLHGGTLVLADAKPGLETRLLLPSLSTVKR